MKILYLRKLHIKKTNKYIVKAKNVLLFLNLQTKMFFKISKTQERNIKDSKRNKIFIAKSSNSNF